LFSLLVTAISKVFGVRAFVKLLLFFFKLLQMFLVDLGVIIDSVGELIWFFEVVI